jgi:predicted phosphohydrolase
MLRIRLVSDLHLGFDKTFKICQSDEDVLIIAGDVSPDRNLTLDFIQDYLIRNKEKFVIFVLGNHDYYYSTIEAADKYWSTVNIKGLYVLQNESVVINGIRFIGSTMWTDMLNGDKLSMLNCEFGINDYKKIINFTTADSVALHLQGKRRVSEMLDESLEPCVVITHHLPSFRSIDVKFDGSLLNAGFASTDMDGLLTHPNCKVWTHGHTHANVQYELESGVSVLCNPKGYGNENIHFDPTFVFEV